MNIHFIESYYLYLSWFILLEPFCLRKKFDHIPINPNNWPKQTYLSINILFTIIYKIFLKIQISNMSKTQLILSVYNREELYNLPLIRPTRNPEI